MHDIDRRRLIQLSGGIALTGIAGCLGDDEDPDEQIDDEYGGDDDESNGDDYDDTEGTDDEPNSGDDAPRIEVETHDGRTITVEARDEPTILLFADVSSENGKSHSEMLVALYEKYHEDAYVLTINSNLDVSKDDLKAFHETYGGDWDHALGTEDVIEKYGLETSVTICVVDEDGTIVFRADGEVDRESIEAAIETYSEH